MSSKTSANRRIWSRRYAIVSMKRRSLVMYLSARYRCKKAGKPLPLPELRDHIRSGLDRGICRLCGLPLELNRRVMGLSPSLDKIDASGDYTIQNTRIVHYQCNWMKGVLPDRIVKQFIRQVMRKAYGYLSKGKGIGAGTAAFETS